jgi:hypothetical protein
MRRFGRGSASKRGSSPRVTEAQGKAADTGVAWIEGGAAVHAELEDVHGLEVAVPAHHVDRRAEDPSDVAIEIEIAGVDEVADAEHGARGVREARAARRAEVKERLHARAAIGPAPLDDVDRAGRSVARELDAAGGCNGVVGAAAAVASEACDEPSSREARHAEPGYGSTRGNEH